MKLYRITHYTPARRYAWAGTQAEAKRVYKSLCEEFERFNVDKPIEVDVPTKKAGLLVWLSLNADGSDA